MLTLLVILMHQLQRHQPRQEGCRIQLADQSLHDHKHPRYFVGRGNVAIAKGRQGDKTEVGEGFLALRGEDVTAGRQTEGIGE